ncbi:MAG: type Z 30S ribosomal protein S14 [Candidatus Gracilibacteria bacterium]|jgi:small subunit ribosomal protein S14
MARTALKIKNTRTKEAFEKALKSGKKPRHSTRIYNRCAKCGKVRGYIRRFGLCRICFREFANTGMIMGIKKSSW